MASNHTRIDALKCLHFLALWHRVSCRSLDLHSKRIYTLHRQKSHSAADQFDMQTIAPSQSLCVIACPILDIPFRQRTPLGSHPASCCVKSKA